MEAKVLRTEEEYEEALEFIETLMNAEQGSSKEEKLDLFALLIEEYEKAHYPIESPDPVEAILFRMDQEGLTRKDLVQLLGSQSKVSEVLNRKRGLSLRMIRSLHEGLGIPAEILLQEPGAQLGPVQYDYRTYPFSEMLKQGYFVNWSGSFHAAKEVSEELLKQLFVPLVCSSQESVFCRRTQSEIDTNALQAWQARALAIAEQQKLDKYDKYKIDDVLVRKIVRASYFDEGPHLAVSLLKEHGVHFVILPHLPRTYLDGAAFLTNRGEPVIGMTLRHDRLDNFWFTLLHEIAHVCLHMGDGTAFFDETDHEPCQDDDLREFEANAFARNALISDDVWLEEGPVLAASLSDDDVYALAERLEIAPAIVAGRVRWETGDYTRFANLIGSGGVSLLVNQ